MQAAIRFTLLLAAALSVFAQSGLQAPRIGYLRDQSGSIRPLIGIRGNFLLGEPLLQQVRSAAFSSSGGIVKTEDEIVRFDGREQVTARSAAPAGDALFGFDSKEAPVAAYFPDTSELYRFDGSELVKVACEAIRPEGSVRAISSPALDVLTLAVDRDGSMWLVSLRASTCEVLSEEALSGVYGSVALVAGGSIVYTNGLEAVVRRRDMSESRVPLTAPSTRLEAVAPDWIQIRGDDGRSWALHVETDSVELFRLPGGVQ